MGSIPLVPGPQKLPRGEEAEWGATARDRDSTEGSGTSGGADDTAGFAARVWYLCWVVAVLAVALCAIDRWAKRNGGLRSRDVELQERLNGDVE